VQYLNGTLSFAPGAPEGESFTTPGGGPRNSISFNFYSDIFYTDIPPATPVAPGTAFLLSMAYAESPAAVSNATPGFIAYRLTIDTFHPKSTRSPVFRFVD
jgi:hypothetical protein